MRLTILLTDLLKKTLESSTVLRMPCSMGLDLLLRKRNERERERVNMNFLYYPTKKKQPHRGC